MKKILALTTVIVLVVAMLAISVSAASTTNSLLPQDAAKWQAIEGAGTATIAFENGKTIISSPSGWPSMQTIYDSPLVFNPEKATLNLKFTLVNGTTSFRLFCGPEDAPEQITLHQFLSNAAYDGVGDLNKAGSYEVSVKFSDLKYYAGSAADAYLGKKDLVTDQDGNISVRGIQIYAIGATVEIEKLEIVIDSAEESTPSQESSVDSTPSQESKDEPTTGDNGVIIPLVITLVSLVGAGAYVSKKSR